MSLIVAQMFNNVTEGPGPESVQTYTLEIGIMLIGAFVLGFLLKFFLNIQQRKRILELEAELLKKPSFETKASPSFTSSSNSSELSRLKSDLAESNALVASLKAKPDNTATVESINKELSLKITEVVSLKTEINNLRSELDACMIAKAAFTATAKTTISLQKDEFRKLEGIGPKIQQLLYDAGISTFKQLSETSVERIKEILLAAGDRYRIHDPNSWPKQAALAAEGKWDELKQLQKTLLSGGE